jgi:hypothetical protein
MPVGYQPIVKKDPSSDASPTTYSIPLLPSIIIIKTHGQRPFFDLRKYFQRTF